MAQTNTMEVTPDRLLGLGLSMAASVAMRAAVELDLFTKIGEGIGTAAGLASACGASEKGIRVLSDFMTIQGFLEKSDGTYRLTAESAAFLDRRSPAFMGSIFLFLAAPGHLKAMEDVTGAVRKGGSVLEHESVEDNNPMWVTFAEAMAPMMAKPAEFIARRVGPLGGDQMRVLDIAAGHGLFGIAFASAYPSARVTGLDWAAVLEVAKKNAAKSGVSDRYSTIPGSAFEVDLGGPYDVVLLPNFLHHFDHATNVGLLKRIRAALKPGGVIATLEFVPNDDRVTPPGAGTFAMTMLLSTARGDAYTFKELAAMMSEAGFSQNEAVPLPAGPQTLVLSRV